MAFQPGQSGNPSGRPKENARVKELARQWTEDAIQTLASVMNDSEAKPGERCAAASALLDRAWGKPAQVVGGDPDGVPVGVTVFGWMPSK